MNDLGNRYQPYTTSSVADVLPYRRRYGSSDYVFAINDQREFGNYVGHHQLVMEQGLPAKADFTIRRQGGHVYDLVEHREVHAEKGANTLRIPVDLEPGGGRLWLVTDNPIEKIAIQAPQEEKCSEDFSVQAAVTDNADNAIDAIIPLELRILDPDGRLSEFSGFYGAKDGKLALPLYFATNDIAGIWTIEIRELASGICARQFVRLLRADQPLDTAENRNGGETEIRTQGRVTPTTAFEAAAFNHSAISPQVGTRIVAKRRTPFQRILPPLRPP